MSLDTNTLTIKCQRSLAGVVAVVDYFNAVLFLLELEGVGCRQREHSEGTEGFKEHLGGRVHWSRGLWSR